MGKLRVVICHVGAPLRWRANEGANTKRVGIYPMMLVTSWGRIVVRLTCVGVELKCEIPNARGVERIKERALVV